jgi:hypothetical protein
MIRVPISIVRILAVIGIAFGLCTLAVSAAPGSTESFPRALDSYDDVTGSGLLPVLMNRIHAEPFNLVATAIFLLAIVHTFLAGKIRHYAHVVEQRHLVRLKAQGRAARRNQRGEVEEGETEEVSFLGQILHFFGEVEAVFGIWAVVLALAIVGFKGGETARHYLAENVIYTEPMFVVIVMTIASTRPVLEFAERLMRGVASFGRGTPAAWWLSVLIVAPMLGSFITEPAAMTIAAQLLAKQFYRLKPSGRLMYATLGLLFVNISIGGTFTHFAAPPVLMVAGPWNWDFGYMFTHFGWKAGVAIVLASSLYYFVFRAELRGMRPAPHRGDPAEPLAPVPLWVTAVHLVFLAFTVWMAHYPVLFIGAFLFFLAFTEATAHHQSNVELRPALLVGFFLAGLVVHGGLQGWWIEPVLTRLDEHALFAGGTVLTAFNDNAAITYLATLVPSFTEPLKYAIVAGAVTGGGLTVIANAPNPAGQSILRTYFPEGISPAGLFVSALAPTLIAAACFLVL